MMTMIILSMSAITVSAAGNVVFINQDFSALRSGFVKDRGGIESIGAYEEDHWKFSGGDGLLANGDGYYVGYVTYKVSAPTNEKIQSLKLDLVGRIGTYEDGGFTAEQWAAKYWMNIYVFKENYAFDRTKWTEYADKLAISPTVTPNPPSSTEEYSFDLSKWASGGKDVYVTIATYAEWTPNWIGFSHLTLSGTTVASATSNSSTPVVTQTPVKSGSSSSKSLSQSSLISEDSNISSTSSSETIISSDEESIVSSIVTSANDSSASSNTSTGSDKPNKNNTWWIILVAIVVVAAAISGIVIMRRNKSTTGV